jgi:hypothetical protein
MATSSKTRIDLGTKFWQSIVNQDTDHRAGAAGRACAHGQLARRDEVRGKAETTAQEMTDTSTWIKHSNSWRCVMHTETPAEATHWPLY